MRRGYSHCSFRLTAPLPQDVREHERDRDEEDGGADDVDLGRHGDARGAPHEEREGLVGARDEVRDDEVVHGEGEGKQEAGQDPRPDERQCHLVEGRPWVGEEIGGGLLEMAVVAGEARSHGHDDEADVEHDVREEDRREPERHAVVQEKREERRAHDDLRGRHREEDEQVRRPVSAEAVANQGERHQRPDRRRDDGREDRDDERQPDGRAELRVVERVQPVVQREALPLEVEAADRVVEGENNHDRDREEQVEEGEDGEEREGVPADERPRTRRRARPVAAHGDGLNRARHATPVVTRSLPTLRAYAMMSTRMMAMRTKESAAACG